MTESIIKHFSFCNQNLREELKYKTLGHQYGYIFPTNKNFYLGIFYDLAENKFWFMFSNNKPIQVYDMEEMNYKYKIDEELKRHLRKKFGIIKWKFDVFLQPEIEDETILFFSKFIREKFYNA